MPYTPGDVWHGSCWTTACRLFRLAVHLTLIKRYSFKTLFVMELYPKRKTDAEYVEATRKQIARSSKFGIFHACGALFFILAFLVLSRLIHSVDGMMEGVSSGVHIGIMFGFMGGIFILFAAQSVIRAAQYFKGQRTKRLMVKFHDELKMKEASNKALHATSEPGPGAASSAREG